MFGTALINVIDVSIDQQDSSMRAC